MRVYIRTLMSVPGTCLLGTRHPALRRQEPGQGHGRERGNLVADAKGEGDSGSPASQEYQCRRPGADALVVVMKCLQ
jgi:hypothetical protein